MVGIAWSIWPKPRMAEGDAESRLTIIMGIGGSHGGPKTIKPRGYSSPTTWAHGLAVMTALSHSADHRFKSGWAHLLIHFKLEEPIGEESKGFASTVYLFTPAFHVAIFIGVWLCSISDRSVSFLTTNDFFPMCIPRTSDTTQVWARNIV